MPVADSHALSQGSTMSSSSTTASSSTTSGDDSPHVDFRSTASVHLIDRTLPSETHLSEQASDDASNGLSSVEDASCPWTVEPWAAGAAAGEEGDRPAVVVGVDYGTSNSCVAVWAVDKRRAKVIKVSGDMSAGAEGAPLLPSAVSFASVPPAVGACVSRGDAGAVFHAKRLIGRAWDDPAVADEAAYCPHELVPVADASGTQRPSYRLRSGGGGGGGGAFVTPDDAARTVLATLAAAARTYVRRHRAPGLARDAPLDAVLTVPAYFGGAQRDAIRAAAEAAGFRVRRLLNEPCAAAMAYGLFLAGTKLALVVDLGGGTLDVSLLRIKEGRMDILGAGGDALLGGEDFTRALMALVLERAAGGGGGGGGGGGEEGAAPAAAAAASTSRGRDAAGRATQRSGALQAAVEAAKIALSSADIATVAVPGAATPPVVVTRGEYDAVCAPLLARLVAAVHDVLDRAAVVAADVQELVVVGGGSQSPAVRGALRELMGGMQICQTIAAGTAVAMGAAIQGAIISGVSAELLKDVLMMDVLTVTWGLEGANGEMVPILPKNAVLPAVARRRFKLHDTSQPGITVEVLEGEAPLARDNKWYTYFNFPTDGASEVDVVYRMSEAGVLSVSVDTHVPTRAMSRRWAFVLFLYAVLAAAMYVAAKFAFADERRAWEQATEDAAAAREAAASGAGGAGGSRESEF